MADDIILGIDLGTTNSACAIWAGDEARIIPNAHGDRLTPSVVAVDDDGSMLVGKAAKQRLVTHPKSTVAYFKRFMGVDHQVQIGRRKKFSATELSAMVLRSLKADAEAELGHPIEHAVISVPAYFNDAQRQATRDAGELAGLTVNRLINEPTAAALAHGLNDEQEQRFIILDLGGGTFDVSILEYYDNVLEVHATAGDSALGGEDFNDNLLRAFLDEIGVEEASLDMETRQALYSRVETVKRQIGKNKDVLLSFDLEGKNREWTIGEQDFIGATSKLLMRIRSPMERALRDAGLNPSAIDDVVLVGGATRMSVFRSMVSKLFGRIPRTDTDPDLTVVMGAALQGALVARNESLEDVVLTDVCSFSMGIASVSGNDPHNMTHIFSPIIERNNVVPVSRVEQFWTVQNDQTAIDVRIYQGESRKPNNNLFLGNLHVPVPKGAAGKESVSVRFSYDVNGLLEVEVTVDSTGRKYSKLIENRPGHLNDKEKAQSLKRLDGLKVLPRDREEVRALTARAERLYSSLLGAERDQLGRAIDDFERVLDRQDPQEIKRAGDNFSKILDMFDRDIWQ